MKTGVIVLNTGENQAIPVSFAGAAIGGGLTDSQLRANPVAVVGSVNLLGAPTVSVSGTVPVTGTFWQATQPVSIAGSVPVTGTFWQATQPVSIAGTVTVTGGLTDTQLRASVVPVSLTSTTITGSVAVTGTFWQATQPVSLASTTITGSVAVTGTFWQATQPVSIAATVTTSDTKLPAALGQTTMAASLPVVIASNQSAVPVSLTSTTITGSVAVTGTFWQATQPVSLTSTTITGTVAVTAPTLTKGTQSANGFSVQNLKDAGRTNLRFFAVAAAAGTTTTETAITLTKSSQDSATTTGTSFTVTNGKTFRIMAISVATRGHSTATIQTTTFNLRMNTAGAVVTTSTPILLALRSATPATASAWDRVIIPLADGIEITGDGTKQWGITAAATYTTNAPTWDVTIIGFEY